MSNFGSLQKIIRSRLKPLEDIGFVVKTSILTTEEKYGSEPYSIQVDIEHQDWATHYTEYFSDARKVMDIDLKSIVEEWLLDFKRDAEDNIRQYY